MASRFESKYVLIVQTKLLSIESLFYLKEMECSVVLPSSRSSTYPQVTSMIISARKILSCNDPIGVPNLLICHQSSFTC